MKNDGISLEFLKERLRKVNQSKQEEEVSDEISLFLSKFKVLKGSDKVETYILHNLYVKMTSSNVKLSRIDFFRKLCKHINTVRWGNQRYYLVDRTSLNLSEDDETNMRINESIRKKEIKLRDKKRS